MTAKRYAAREADRGVLGWALYDWACSAYASAAAVILLPLTIAALAGEEGASFRLFGVSMRLHGDILWAYSVSATTLAVALMSPILGAAADAGGSRKRWLYPFCFLGAAATALLAVAPGLGGALFLAALSLIGFEAANIFYNALLPEVAAEKDRDRVSSLGFAWGYAGGGIALLLCILLIRFRGALELPSDLAAMRLSFVIVGIWWAVFAWIGLRRVREEPRSTAAGIGLIQMAGAGFRQFRVTLAHARNYPQLLRLLIAYLLYNDGIQTINVMAATFGESELGMSRASLLGCYLMIQFVSIPGAMLFAFLAKQWSPKRALMLAVAGWLGVTGYASAMRSEGEFWILAVAVGTVLGGSQALSRSIYSRFLPPDRSAEFFGLFATCGKFASVLGPILYGVIRQATGSPRPAILSLLAFFAVGLALLSRVDIEQGRREARTEAALPDP